MNDTNETGTMVDVQRSFAAKVRRGMFNPVARHLRTDIAEDRLAEGIAMIFELYKTSVERGDPLPDALLVHGCQMRAIDLSRRVAGSQGAHPKRDAYEPRNLHGRQTGALESRRRLRGHGEGQSTLGFDEPGTPHPARRLASAVDLEAWLLSLDAEDRLVLALRQAGDTLEEGGQACGKSINWARHRLLRLVGDGRAVDRAHGGEKATKTGRSRRFSVESNILPVLAAMRAEFGGKGPIVSMPRMRDLAEGLRSYLKVAGVAREELYLNDDTRKSLRWHDLRATGCTWMAVRGDAPLHIQHRAGHTSFGATQLYIRQGAIRDGFGEAFPPLPMLLERTHWSTIGPKKTDTYGFRRENLRRGRDSKTGQKAPNCRRSRA